MSGPGEVRGPVGAPAPLEPGAPVIVAMSGGVDSSVAAALLAEAGLDVTGVTMRLWGGESDTGCCSAADVDDARRVAQQLDIAFHVFDFSDDFDRHVVGPYVADHERGRTPNPCIECNRHLKFDRLLRRADSLGAAAIATGHHARIVCDGSWRRVARGADPAKDQSYVLGMLTQAELARLVLPIGHLTKHEVRAHATRLGLRTAAKPDSQDVCFITSAEGRRGFLERRLDLAPGVLLDAAGQTVGHVDALELVTVGQRKGLGLAGGGAPRFVVSVDRTARTARVGGAEDLVVDAQPVEALAWSAEPVEGELLVQCSAHGAVHPAVVVSAVDGAATVRWQEPQRRVAPGQAVVLYDGDRVVGSATASDGLKDTVCPEH